MPGRIEWVKRKFAFDFPVDVYPEILERLRGTPARMEERVKDISPDLLTARPENKWSIQEHIGHLGDLESLLQGRIEDFTAGEETLRGADMTNRKTEEARHNESALDILLATLRKVRGETVTCLEELNPEDFGKEALHPRLKVPMRLVDVMYFHAEHDDYHLARITDMIRSL